MIKRKDSISAIRHGKMTEFVLAPKQALAVIVMIAFIMVCVLAPFGAAHAIVGISTAAVTILIAGLAAIGITFASTGGFDTLEDYVSSILQDYATDQNIPVTSIFNGTQYGANAAGKLILNNRFVQLISGFANWLKIKYNLTNNSSISVVEPGISVYDYTCYSFPFTVSYNTGISLTFSSSANKDSFVLIYTDSSNDRSVKFMAFGYEPFSVQTTRYRSGYDPVIQNYNSTTYGNLNYIDNICSPYPSYSQFNNTPNQLYCNVIPNATDMTQAKNTILGNIADIPVEESNVGISINTGSIDIPTDRTDYTGDSGAILDVNAPWSIPVSGVIDSIPDAWSSVEDDITIYSLDLEAEDVIEQQLPQPSDIENLPGATIPGLPDIDGEPWHFEFSNLWHYVAQWISDMSAGGAVIWNTCIQAPPAIINFVFAGIVLAMWFGAIKILR